MPDRYAVIGNPVAHSKSPYIHSAFAAALNQDMTYERLLVPLKQFRVDVDAFRAAGATDAKGANVTMPFKIDAFNYATELTERARRAGAVNTLGFDGARVWGDNTDGVGLLRDIEINLGVAVRGARVLIVGAGGAARGVAGDLVDAHPAHLAIANRTVAKAEEIARAIEGVEALPIAALVDYQFDIVINATSASLEGQLPAVPLKAFAPGCLAYDMMYGKGDTPFMQLAAGAGARTADGLGMLVEQAAEAFFLWRGVRPATAPVMAALKRTIERALGK
jgi:shikimate dehydrogenase